MEPPQMQEFPIHFLSFKRHQQSIGFLLLSDVLQKDIRTKQNCPQRTSTCNWRRPASCSPGVGGKAEPCRAVTSQGFRAPESGNLHVCAQKHTPCPCRGARVTGDSAPLGDTPLARRRHHQKLSIKSALSAPGHFFFYIYKKVVDHHHCL